MKLIPRLLSPVTAPHPAPTESLGLTITSPLTIYRNLISAGVLTSDPHQHHAAIIVQSVYERLLDYKPSKYNDLKKRLDSVTKSLRAIESSRRATQPSGLTKPKRTWRDNEFLPSSLQSPAAQSKALIRTFSNEDELLNISSPRGLLLSGDVGTGKSMLTDLLASSLPIKEKKRVHFDTFMLGIYKALEDHRRKGYLSSGNGSGEDMGYSILSVARQLVEDSTVLFLDEFQMPDKASGRILKSLLSNFWMLGGVLIATSNRLPETLVKGTGVEWMRRKEEFGVFEEVLRRRCEVWEMGGGRDYRRRGGGRIVAVGFEDKERVVEVPGNYFLKEGDMKEAWVEAVEAVKGGEWEARKVVVYGREVVIRRTRESTAMFDFDQICGDLLGPADYITIASNFSTIIIDNVPVLTSKSHRHEARRFITLLDAIYECRCKLLMRAEVPIEELFFPDATESSDSSEMHSESYAEAHQDLTVPFRPNISLYDQQLPEDPNDPLTWKRKYKVADQDSEFSGKVDVDFGNTKKFTGEDEKFAFKRAVSRVWEVCGEKWWDATTRGPIHSPMPREIRQWEGHYKTEIMGGLPSHTSSSPENEYDPLRPDAPRFMPIHIWGIVDSWGKRAGRWGKGVNAYKDDDTRDKSSAAKSGE